jgi:hypothetical protein
MFFQWASCVYHNIIIISALAESFSFPIKLEAFDFIIFVHKVNDNIITHKFRNLGLKRRVEQSKKSNPNILDV